MVRRGNGDVDCHELLIGRRRASLERVMPAAWLRAFRGSCGRHEELAVRALEPAVTLGLAGHQFSRERLLAVWAPDLVHRVLGGKVSHSSQGTCAPVRSGQKEAVRLERSPLGCRRPAPASPEMDEAEESFSVRQTDGLATRLRPEDVRSAPVAGEATGMRARAGRRRSRWPPRTDPPRPARGPRSGLPRQEPVSALGRASELRSGRQPPSGGRASQDRERESATGSSGGGSEPNARARAARRACPPGRARGRTTCASGANGSVRRRLPGRGH